MLNNTQMYSNSHLTGKLIFIICSFLVTLSCSDPKTGVSGTKSDSTAVPVAGAEELSREIEKDPSNAELYYKRAIQYFNQKYLDRALADIDQASSLSKDNPLYYFTRGRVLYAMNRTSEAAKMYESAITLKPDYEEAQMKLAELFYVVKEHKKSVDLLNLVIAQSKRADAYFLRGMNQKESGDTARAIASFQLAAEADETNYDAIIQLGLLFTEKKDAIAVDYFGRALKMNPKSSEAYFGRAYYYQLTKQFQKALFDYRKVIDLDPSNDKAYYNVGYINFEAGKLKEALRSWDICIQMNNANIQAYYMRGLVHETLKNPEDARLNYEFALQLNPEYQLAKDGLKRVIK